MFGYGHGGWMFGGGVMMAMWWLLPVALLVSLLIYWLKPSGPPDRDAPNALEILKQRYARGEIGREEFEQKKKDIGG